jgi:Lon-like ATP-dependent protease
MTGSLSVRGDVLPVGGVTYKIEAAAKAGFDRVIVPAANLRDVMVEEEYHHVEVIPVRHVSEVLEIALVGYDPGDRFLDRARRPIGRALDAAEGVGSRGRSGGPSPAPG